MGSQEVESAASGDVSPGGLAWVGRLLLDGSVSADDVVVTETPPTGYRSVLAFRALPNARHPYLLMPLGSRAAAAGSVHHIGNPLKRRMRVAESALSLSFHLGIGQRVLNRHLHVCVPTGVVTDAPNLVDRAMSLVGRDDLSAAVILGRDRPNRKPVLKLLGPDGEPVAFAKVGWNEISRSLVRHETSMLTVLGTDERRPSSFHVPAVIGFEEGDQTDLLLVTPVPQASGLRGGPPSEVPMRATHEVAVGDGVSWNALADGAYWSSLRDRVGDAANDLTNPLGGDQARAVDELERAYGSREVPFGSWHGDWTPWNMTRVDGSLFVWDWERAEGPVPVGLDLLHFDFDVRVKIDGHSPSRAIHESVVELGPRLEALGLPSGLTHLLATLHLLEMTLRFQQARAQGVDVADTIYGPALQAILRSRTAA
jgi:hypothetical protein